MPLSTELLQGAVQAHAAPDGYGCREAVGIGTAGCHDGASGHQVGQHDLALLGLHRAELCDRPAADGHDDTVAGTGAPQVSGEIGSEFADTQHR